MFKSAPREASSETTTDLTIEEDYQNLIKYVNSRNVVVDSFMKLSYNRDREAFELHPPSNHSISHGNVCYKYMALGGMLKESKIDWTYFQSSAHLSFGVDELISKNINPEIFCKSFGIPLNPMKIVI